MNFTAAIRISNFRMLLPSFLRLLSFVSERTDKSVHFRLNFLYSMSIVVAVIVVVVVVVVVAVITGTML